jgi:hypothetical protein
MPHRIEAQGAFSDAAPTDIAAPAPAGNANYPLPAFAEKPLATGRIQTARAGNFASDFKARTRNSPGIWRELSHT